MTMLRHKYEIIAIMRASKILESTNKSTVGCAILIRDGAVLVLKRGPTAPWKPNTWNLPGGTADAGETPLECAQRELEEEAGIKAELNPTQIFHHEDDGWTISYFVAYDDSEKIPELDFENTEYAFVTVGELDQYDWAIPQIAEAIKRALVSYSKVAASTVKTLVLAKRLVQLSKMIVFAVAPVPTSRQKTSYTCGAASVLSVVKYYGLDTITEEYLAEQMGSSPSSGTDIDAMAKMFDVLGLETKSGEMTLDDLKRYTATGVPVIVALQAWGDNGVDVSKSWEDGHYSVVMSVGNTEIDLMDPVLEGAIKNMPIDEFTKCWHDKDAEGTKLYSWGMAVSQPAANK